MVNIVELETAIAIANGEMPPESCLSADANDDGRVTVNEEIEAVNSALQGCPLMEGVVMAEDMGTATVHIGSAAGVAGSEVELTVDVLDAAGLAAGVNVDVAWCCDQEYVLADLQCVLPQELADSGFALTDGWVSLYGKHLVVSQALDAMQSPGPTMADGAFAICTAFINSFVSPGVYTLHGGVAGDSNLTPAMVSDVYGDHFNTVVADGAIVVNGTGPPAATFVSQDVPTSMIAGQQYTVSLTMQNTGNTVWTASPLPRYALGAVNPADNVTWGMSRVAVQTGGEVTPGSSTAVSQPGVAIAPSRGGPVPRRSRPATSPRRRLASCREFDRALRLAACRRRSYPSGHGVGQRTTRCDRGLFRLCPPDRRPASPVHTARSD